MFSPKTPNTILADLGSGVYCIDAQYVRPGLACIYLLVSEGRVAFIETGTVRSLPQVLGALAALGLNPSDVDLVIPTHVHLDHAGGAGAMMAAFPGARLLVHPRGARHMSDPSRLWAGTIEVYGEQRARALYGEIIPVAPDRIDEAADGQVVRFGTRSLTILDTPGHCRHHICALDQATSGIFTGDMLGLSYRELDVGAHPSVMITTTPTQFDPDEMRRSIDRIAALNPRAAYMTHFSRVGDVSRLVGELHRQLDAHVQIAELSRAEPDHQRGDAIIAGLSAFFRAERDRLGWNITDDDFERLVMPDVHLNSRGLVHWLSAKDRQG